MSYIGAEPDGMGKAQRFTFTASGTGTAVTADDAGVPIGYTAGQVSVYLNGVKQVIPTDVVASNGSTITFTSSYASGDVIEVVALSIFSATTVEGADIISTGVTGTSKYLRVDGDGTSSWQTVTIPTDFVSAASGGTFGGNVIMSGNLTVNGTETILNTQTVEVEDNILQLNTTQASPDTATAATSGISVYRGNGVTQASLIFDDADDAWDITNDLVLSTTGKVKQKGAFMQSSTHQALTLGG